MLKKLLGIPEDMISGISDALIQTVGLQMEALNRAIEKIKGRDIFILQKVANVYRINDKKPFSSDISSLQKGNNNDMWIGTLGDGLYVIHISNRKVSRVLLHNLVDTIYNINCIQYWENSIWVGTELGLFKIEHERKPEFIELKTNVQNITELAVHANQLAIGTKDNGLIIYNQQGQQRHLGFLEEQINALQSMNKNKLLVGTQSAGLYCINISDSVYSKECYNKPFDENPPLINEILVDKNDNIFSHQKSKY